MGLLLANAPAVDNDDVTPGAGESDALSPSWLLGGAALGLGSENGCTTAEPVAAANAGDSCVDTALGVTTALSGMREVAKNVMPVTPNRIATAFGTHNSSEYRIA